MVSGLDLTDHQNSYLFYGYAVIVLILATYADVR